MNKGERILQVDGLETRFYTGESIVHAINGVSFEIGAGETLGVVGESGSGKSVTMMSIVGLIPIPPGKIENGRAELNTSGQTVDLLSKSEEELRHYRGGKIGFIFQDPISSLNPVMTIGRQIAEAMMTHLSIDQATARRQTIQLLERVGIADADRRYNAYPHEFSGGMRQRVMIAMAVSCQPEIVIADEPTTALDVTVQAQIIELVKALQAELGMAVVWISHDLGVVAGLADRVLVMYGGTIVESAQVDDLFERPQHPYTMGLLGAMPDLGSSGRRLVSIEGVPPDLLSPLDFCPFAARCSYVMDRCWEERPTLRHVDIDHKVACFYEMSEAELAKFGIGEE